MAWQLEVYHNGSTFTYDVTVIHEGDYEIEEAATSDAIELSDIEIMLDGAFLEATDIDDLPVDDGDGHKNWRARLLHGGLEYINGLIYRRGGARWEPDYEQWIIRLQSASMREFLDRLEEIHLADETYTPDPTLIAALRPTNFIVEIWGRSGYLIGYNRLCYRIDALWEAVISLLGNVTVNHSDLFRYDVDYNDGADKTISRLGIVCLDAMAGAISGGGVGPFEIAPSLPEWTGKDLFESLQSFHGWTPRAEYDSFPSRDITVDLVDNVWEDPIAPPVWTKGDVEEEGLESYVVEDPEYEDLGVKYSWIEGGFGDLNFRNWEGARYVGEIESRFHPEAFIGQHQEKLYAAEVRKYDAKGEPSNEDIIELPFYLPYVWAPQWEMDTTPDGSGHPNYQEDVLHAEWFIAPQESRGMPHLLEVTTFPGKGNVLLLGRRVRNVDLQEHQYNNNISAINPMQVIRNYQIATSEAISLEVKIDIEDSSPAEFRVGYPSYGVTFDNDDYMVRSRSESPFMKSIVLNLIRFPALGKGFSLDGGIDFQTPTPLQFDGVGACIDDDFNITLSWVAPSEDPVSYEIQWRPYYQRDWDDLVTVNFPDDEYQFSTEAFGEERGVFFFRIRALYDDATNPYSEWIPTMVECPTCGAVGEAGEFPAACYEVITFTGSIPAGQTETWVKPDRFFSSSQGLRYWNIEPITNLNGGSHLWRGIVDGDRFKVHIDTAPSALVQFHGTVTRIKEEVPECAPCWLKDRWFEFGGIGACTQFQDPASSSDFWQPFYDSVNDKFVFIPLRERSALAATSFPVILYDPPRYDPDTGNVSGNTWSTGATLTTESSTYGIKGAIHNGILYVTFTDCPSGGSCGGVPPNDQYGALWEYNVASNTWNRLSDMPADPGGSGHASIFPLWHTMFAFNSKIYVVGGMSTTFPAFDPVSGALHANCLEYNPSTDGWSIGPAFPLDTVLWAAGAVVCTSSTCASEKFMLIGGRERELQLSGGTYVLADVGANLKSYNFTGSWTQDLIQNLPEARYLASVMRVNSWIHVVGGWAVSLGVGDFSTYRLTNWKQGFDNAISFAQRNVWDQTPRSIDGGLSSAYNAGSSYRPGLDLAEGGGDLGGDIIMMFKTNTVTRQCGCYTPFETAMNPFSGELSQ